MILKFDYKKLSYELSTNICYLSSIGSAGLSTSITEIQKFCISENKDFYTLADNSSVNLHTLPPAFLFNEEYLQTLDSNYHIYFIDEDYYSQLTDDAYINLLQYLTRTVLYFKNVYLVIATRQNVKLPIQQQFLYALLGDVVISCDLLVAYFNSKREHLLAKRFTNILIEDSENGLSYFKQLLQNKSEPQSRCIESFCGIHNIENWIAFENIDLNKPTLIIYDSLGVAQSIYYLLRLSEANPNIYLLAIKSLESMLLESSVMRSRCRDSYMEELCAVWISTELYMLTVDNRLITKEQFIFELLVDILSKGPYRRKRPYTKSNKRMDCLVGDCGVEDRYCIKACAYFLSKEKKTYFDSYPPLVRLACNNGNVDGLMNIFK